MFPLRDNVPTRHFPVVTVGLIAANVLFYFLYERGGLQAAVEPVNELAFHPCEVDDSCRVVGEDWPLTAFTSMFMHADIIHLGGNMLFLWIFGNNVEDALGRVRFLLWYLAAGLAATAAQTIVTLGWGTAQDAAIPNLGASGAIAGVLGAYFLILPRASVLTAIFLGFLFFLREVPAILFLGVWIAFQLWQGGFSLVQPEQGGGVAFFAHIGGFIFGALTIHLVKSRTPLRPSY
jgi:membrane associated rhomboid family serine protease